MQLESNPKRVQSRSQSEKMRELFEAYDKLTQQGQRFFSDWNNDDCIHDSYNDDDADCNYNNCC